MADRFPSPIYAETVLRVNFEDAKRYFLDSLLEIHYAHTRMLGSQGIVSAADEGQLIGALDKLDRTQIQQAQYDGGCEDLFFYVERLLEELCGRELAGKMHTARSRNDIAVTLYRMATRAEILKFAGTLAGLRRAVLTMADRHIETVMPAHTHTQPAQPTTLAHYLLAVTEFLARDAERLRAAFGRVNLSPMGSAAITTSGFPIDRRKTAELLGFEGLAENSYGAIASIDYITETASVIAVAMVNVGKFVQDLLLWSTREFGFLRLSDAFVQASSIMPQKRNPVALEHARILASRALGEAQAVLTCAHNTPFGDINDSEDDLQRLIFTMFADAVRTQALLAGAIACAEVNRDRLAQRSRENFITVTELADTLVRRERMSFREAHVLVAEAVRSSLDDDPRSIAAALRVIRPSLEMTDADVIEALDPYHFVNIRRAVGGPAPEQTRQALSNALEQQNTIEQWIVEKRTLLERARKHLRSTAAQHG